MKRFAYFAASLLLLTSAQAFAGQFTKRTTPPQDQKKEFEDEKDKTDVLAIPLDTSEAEEQEEIERLEKGQKPRPPKKERTNP